MAAFCTQCGAAIPSSAQARPRGMDRQELDARIRQRRPGDARLRRGTPFDGSSAPAVGYLPFEPAPEDSQAVRQSAVSSTRVDNTPAGFDAEQVSQPPSYQHPEPYQEPETYREPERDQEPEPYHEPEPVRSTGWPYAAEPPAHEASPGMAAPDQGAYEEPYAQVADEQEREYEPYGAPEDAYPYPYAPAEEQRRGGPGLLPVIGFAVLAVLALGIGAALAGILGAGGVANASATPTASQTEFSSTEPSVEATPSADGPSASPEPTDGPITFPDGAELTVQPCATQAMSFDGCARDGSTVRESPMWVWVGFSKASGSDTITLELRSDGQTIDQQEKELGSVLDCPGTCSGYLIGAAYRDLGPGDYELVVRRNGDFADSATFTVES